LNGPHPELFPQPNGQSVVIVTTTLPLFIENFEEHGCTLYPDAYIMCREQSSPYALMDIDIPDGTAYIEFEYNFINRGDGDYVSVLLDGIPIWTLQGDSVVGDSYTRSGALPISQDLVGQHKMTVALYGVNELNAVLQLRNFTAISVEDDDDNDGVANSGDLCAETPLGVIVDPGTGCSIDQLCPCDAPRGTNVIWRNHGQYVSCVARSSEAFVEQELMTEAEKDETVSSAAQFSCGKKK
jgi:hypothetical protein